MWPSLHDRCIDDVLIAGNDSPIRSRLVIVISNHVIGWVVPTRADVFFVPSSSGASATRRRLLWIVARVIDVDG